MSARWFAGGLGFVLLVAGALVAGPATRVSAHAVLIRSSPAAEARLEVSPPAIDLWFSEPLESRFSTFELLDATGRARPLDGVGVDAGDLHHMSGFPRRLPGGIYTVTYRTVSQLDGHEWTGTFAFTVLNADGSAPSGTAYLADTERGSTPALVAGRWFLFIGFSVLVGGAALVLLDAAGRRPAGRDALSEDAAALYRRLATATLPLLGGGLALTFVNQVLALDAAPLEVLLSSRFGVWWLVRLSIVLGVVAVLALAHARASAARGVPGTPRFALALPLLGVAGMATITAQSHAAAAPGAAWAMAFDVLHFAAAGSWVGGLVGLAALFARGAGQGARHAEALLRRWVMPFSTVAALSIFVVGVTGVLRGFGELPTSSALVTTDYGRVLLAKLALITPALGIAWLNRRAPERTGVSAVETARRLRRLLAIEGTIAVVVLLSVALLGQVPTARGYARQAGPVAGTAQDFNGIAAASDLTVHLQVSPARLGVNQLRVHAYRPDGSDPGEITRVRVTLATSALSGGQQLDATPQGGGVFVSTDAFFSLAQGWNVRVEVQRTGRDDVAVAFDVPIAEAAQDAGRAGLFSTPAPQLTLNALAAVVLLMTGGAVLYSRGKHGSSTARVAGGLLVGASLMLWVSGETHPPDATSFPANPVPPDAASQARGEAIYSRLCVSCHGVTGEGNGPLATTLNPPPASLAVHMPLHPDGQAYIFISKGFPGTAMPAWEKELSSNERWDLVNYLRALTSTQVR